MNNECICFHSYCVWELGFLKTLLFSPLPFAAVLRYLVVAQALAAIRTTSAL